MQKLYDNFTGKAGKVASEEGGFLNGGNVSGTLVGLNGQDVIRGNGGDDIIVGGGNTDKLYGDNGDDILFGGRGFDRMTGGKGSDVFITSVERKADTITDFRKGDLIGLTGNITFADLTFTQLDRATKIIAGSREIALLESMRPGQLTAQDFTQFNLTSLNTRVRADVAVLNAQA